MGHKVSGQSTVSLLLPDPVDKSPNLSHLNLKLRMKGRLCTFFLTLGQQSLIYISLHVKKETKEKGKNMIERENL